MVLQYKEHLSNLKAEIDVLVKEIEEYTIIQSIPGIEKKKSRQRLFLTLVKLIGLIILKNLWLSLELIRVSLNPVNSEPVETELQNAVLDN